MSFGSRESFDQPFFCLLPSAFHLLPNGPHSLERNGLHPARTLSRGVFAEELKCAGRLIDAVHGNRFRLLSRRNEVAATRIDREGARLLLGGEGVNERELSRGGIDLQPVQRAVRPLGKV